MGLMLHWGGHCNGASVCGGLPGGYCGLGFCLQDPLELGKRIWRLESCGGWCRSAELKGLFCDYRELLKSIQNSYNPQVNMTELELLKPVFAAEVLVIDDMGAQKPNEWVWDTVALILNTRYNDKQTTIITTNYANQNAGGGAYQDETGKKLSISDFTLGDRIGDRMRSRLAEMCIEVPMNGNDLRQSVKRASFG